MLTLRRAVPGDEASLLVWRNDPLTRKASFQQEEVSSEDHRAWFVRKHADPDCAILIIEDDGRPIGQVRLERLQPDLAEVHVGLAAEARGRGLGREALQLAVRQAPQLLGVQNLCALVKAENDMSLRAFGAAGFEETGRTEDVVELRRSVAAEDSGHSA
jgi:RimJ/RimL family protein N-acetyltransferase